MRPPRKHQNPITGTVQPTTTFPARIAPTLPLFIAPPAQTPPPVQQPGNPTVVSQYAVTAFLSEATGLNAGSRLMLTAALRNAVYYYFRYNPSKGEQKDMISDAEFRLLLLILTRPMVRDLKRQNYPGFEDLNPEDFERKAYEMIDSQLQTP